MKHTISRLCQSHFISPYDSKFVITDISKLFNICMQIIERVNLFLSRHASKMQELLGRTNDPVSFHYVLGNLTTSVV